MQLNRLTTRKVETIQRAGVYNDGGGLFLRVRGDGRHWLFVFRLNRKRPNWR